MHKTLRLSLEVSDIPLTHRSSLSKICHFLPSIEVHTALQAIWLKGSMLTATSLCTRLPDNSNSRLQRLIFSCQAARQSKHRIMATGSNKENAITISDDEGNVSVARESKPEWVVTTSFLSLRSNRESKQYSTHARKALRKPEAQKISREQFPSMPRF